MVVVDDQTLVREAFAVLLARLPGIDVVGTAPDGHSALAVVDTTAPDVVLLDLRMPGLDGTATTRRLRGRHPEVAVLLLTTYLHDSAIVPALRAGALGAVGKDSSPEYVAAAVRAVHDGVPVLPAGAQQQLLGRPADGPTRLSAREVEVLRLIAEGLTNAQIARRLVVSVSTVKTHVNNLFGKLEIGNRTEAVARATGLGLLR